MSSLSPTCNQGSGGRCPHRHGHRADHLRGVSHPGTHASVAAHADGRTLPLSDAGTRHPGDPPGTPRLSAAKSLHVVNQKPRETQLLCPHQVGHQSSVPSPRLCPDLLDRLLFGVKEQAPVRGRHEQDLLAVIQLHD